MLHSNTRQVFRTPKQQRNKKDTTYLQILLLLVLLLPFLPPHVLLALGTSHAPSLLLTHTYTQHTARTQEQEKMSQQPARCPHTTYELDSPGWRTEARVRRDEQRTSFTAAEARPARRGTGSRRQRKAPPPRRPLRRANEGHQTTELRGCLRAREASATACSGLLLAPSQLPSGIWQATYMLIYMYLRKKPEETRLKAKSKPRRIGTPYRSAGLGTRI